MGEKLVKVTEIVGRYIGTYFDEGITADNGEEFSMDADFLPTAAASDPTLTDDVVGPRGTFRITVEFTPEDS